MHNLEVEDVRSLKYTKNIEITIIVQGIEAAVKRYFCSVLI